MLQQLLRRLVFDVPLLTEYCKMPLRVGKHRLSVSPDLSLPALSLSRSLSLFLISLCIPALSLILLSLFLLSLFSCFLSCLSSSLSLLLSSSLFCFSVSLCC